MAVVARAAARAAAALLLAALLGPPIEQPAAADDRPVMAKCFRLDNGRELLRHRDWFGSEALHDEVPCTRAHLDDAKRLYEEGCVAGRYEESVICAREREAMIWLEETLWLAAGGGKHRR